MEGYNSMDKYEILEIEEEEVDWINPRRKVIRTFPDEIMTSIKHTASNERILRKPDSDLFLVYIGNKLFLFNSSNLHFVTNARMEGEVNTAKLTTKSLCFINFEKEIKQITINPIKSEYFCMIFEDSIKVYKFEDLLKFISNPITKITLSPAINYKIPSNLQKENSSAYVFDSDELKILINLKNQMILFSPPNQSISVPIFQASIDHLLMLGDQIFLSSYEDVLTFHLFDKEAKKFVELKSLKFKLILNSDEEKNDFTISHLAIFKNFLCVGVFQKEEKIQWDEYSKIQQNFLFIDFSIMNQVVQIKKIYKSEWVFNYNDDYNFKTAPKFQSIFYEDFNIFILTSNQYHQAEIYYLEEDDNQMKIVKGQFEDDQRIFVPRNRNIDKLSLCEGIQIIDFKHENYQEDKITLISEEILTPPLLLLLNDIGNLVVYYLPNRREITKILKEKYSTPTLLIDKQFDFKYEETKPKPELTGNLFGNQAIKPPDKLIFPKDLQDSPKISSKNFEFPKENVKKPESGFFTKNDAFKVQSPESIEQNINKKVLTEKNEKISEKKEPFKSIEQNIIGDKISIGENYKESISLMKESYKKPQIKLEILQNKIIPNPEDEKGIITIKSIEDEFRAKNEILQKQKEKELWIKLKFENLQSNLKRQLDLYLNIISSYNLDILDLLKSLDKKVNLSKSEKDLNTFMALSEKVCKENLDMNKIIPEFKKFQEKISHLCSQKDLIDKIAKNAEKTNPDYFDIDKLILSHYSENNSQDQVNISQTNFKKRIQNFSIQIEQLKTFLNDFKKFQNEFGEMSSINKKIKNNNKYEGIFRKFKSVSTTKIADNSLKSTGNNLTQYSTASQSSLYETIMKKFEEIFINLDHRYYIELKPKLEKILNEMKKSKLYLRTEKKMAGFSISEMDISTTYQRIKEDVGYLGDNPIENIFLYKMLIGELSNILHNTNPKVTRVDSRMSSKQNLEDFFLKDNKSKMNKAVEKNSTAEVTIQSESYLMKVLDKIRKKKEERDKIKIDLDFKIEEFYKLEKSRIISGQNLKESKESEIVYTNSLNKHEIEKEKAKNILTTNNDNFIQNDSKKNINGTNFSFDDKKDDMKEKKIEKQQKEKKKPEDEKPFGVSSKLTTGFLKNQEEKKPENEKTFSVFNNPKVSENKFDFGSKNINLSENKGTTNLFGTSEPKTISITENKSSSVTNPTNKNANDTKINVSGENKPDEKNSLLNIFGTKNKEVEKKTDQTKPSLNIFGAKENEVEKKQEEMKPIPNNLGVKDDVAEKNKEERKDIPNIFSAKDNLDLKKQDETKHSLSAFGKDDKKQIPIFGNKEEKPKELTTKPSDSKDSFNNTIEQNFGNKLNLLGPNLSNNSIESNKQQSSLQNRSFAPIPDEKNESLTADASTSEKFNNNNHNNQPDSKSQEPSKNNILDRSCAPNQLNTNNFKGISLANNLFNPNNPASQLTISNLPSNIVNNPLNPNNHPINNINSPSDLMNKPAFGAKSNLGMINPLNNVANVNTGNQMNIGSAFASYGNTNTSSFSNFSSKNSGFSGFTLPQAQNIQSINQQPNNQNFTNSMSNNQINQNTTGFAGFQQANSGTFFNNQPNQQMGGSFSNLQFNPMNGFNKPQNTFGANNTNNMGSNLNNNFFNTGNGGNNMGVNNNNNQPLHKTKDKPDYDLF